MIVRRVGMLLMVLACLNGPLRAETLVPGTGLCVAKVGDNFENSQWSYKFNLPKSSDENDKQQRAPGGESTNGRWFEGIMRGQPDVIERVATPEGGIPGSEGALLLRSLHTGVPSHFSGKNEQDDLIVNVANRIGGAIPVYRSPSVVVRVFLPPWDEWEQRTGNHFGFRAACLTHKSKPNKAKRFGGSSIVPETYWPGMFIHFNKATAKTPDSAQLVLRAGPNGQDFFGPKIKEPGWWTLGMSFTSDGQVHYYARAGVDSLTSADYISTQNPYSYRCERVETFFFNVVNGNNGKWSTSWIIDDPALYYGRYDNNDVAANRETRGR